MKVNNLHNWDVSPKEAVAIQKEFQERIILSPILNPPTFIAGLDVSYDKGSHIFYSAVVALRLPELEVVDLVSASEMVTFPYIPGLLSFREGPVVLEALKKLKTEPDLLVFDGQGIAHPRGLGIASHIGLIVDIPSIGCAKTRLCGEYEEPESIKGSWSPLVLKGEEVGAVIRTKDNVQPVFVSPGHRVDVAGSLKIMLQCTGKYRIPEPTRQAHIAVNRIRREAGSKELSSY